MEYLLWDGKQESDEEVIHRGDMLFYDWSRAKNYYPTENTRTKLAVNSTWSPPAAGAFTCNVDASFFMDVNVTGMRLSVRDDRGSHVVSRTEVKRRSVEPFRSYAVYPSIRIP